MLCFTPMHKILTGNYYSSTQKMLLDKTVIVRNIHRVEISNCFVSDRFAPHVGRSTDTYDFQKADIAFGTASARQLLRHKCLYLYCDAKHRRLPHFTGGIAMYCERINGYFLSEWPSFASQIQAIKSCLSLMVEPIVF